MTKMFCPVYKEACETQPWKNTTGVNAGLLFDKFAEAWTWKIDKRGQVVTDPRVPLFGVGAQNKKEKDKKDYEKQGYWIRQLPTRIKPNSELLKETCQRQQDLVSTLDGYWLCVKNTSRFVTGMGRQHPLENGFTFHHTLGVPYLPGSSLKGALRAWLRETDGQWDNKHWEESEQTKDWFGTQNAGGRFIFLDMLPSAPPNLCVDVMTPHYGPYYQNCEKPGDWHSPVPIQFITVEEDCFWQIGILPVPGQRPLHGDEITQVMKNLLNALEWVGAGAKTAVGYGRFQQDPAAEEDAHRKSAQRRREQEELRKRREELAQLSPELAELYRRTESENWQKDKSAFLTGVERYLDENASPGREVTEKLREMIERRDPGIWENPDKTKGKKKMPAYKERPRNIVARLKSAINGETP